MTTTLALAQTTSIAQACEVLGVARSSFYRWQSDPVDRVMTEPPERATPARALSDLDQAAVRTELNSERFVDKAPREVYATLMDEGVYLCHWRTMYRILVVHDEVHERRD